MPWNNARAIKVMPHRKAPRRAEHPTGAQTAHARVVPRGCVIRAIDLIHLTLPHPTTSRSASPGEALISSITSTADARGRLEVGEVLQRARRAVVAVDEQHVAEFVARPARLRPRWHRVKELPL